MLRLPHLGRIEGQDPYLAETLRSIMTAINQHGVTVGVDPTGAFPAPNAPSQLLVTSVAGGFDVSVVDSNPQRGVLYYVEFSATADFGGARAVPLFTTRNVYLPLGNQAFFFRAYATYQGSDVSGYTYFGGGTPQSVMGGAAGTPTLQPTQGTGAGPGTGSNPFPPVGRGFGPVQNLRVPLRNLPGGQ